MKKERRQGAAGYHKNTVANSYSHVWAPLADLFDYLSPRISYLLTDPLPVYPDEVDQLHQVFGFDFHPIRGVDKKPAAGRVNVWV